MLVRRPSCRADRSVLAGATGHGSGQRKTCKAQSRRSYHFSAASAVAAALLAFLLLAAPATGASARVLTDADFERIAEIRTSFTAVMRDLATSAQRTDIAANDADCIRQAMSDLLSMSNELSSYEHLITIESQMSDFGDDGAMKGILRFALDKATKMLGTEQARLTRLSQQCSNYATSVS